MGGSRVLDGSFGYCQCSCSTLRRSGGLCRSEQARLTFVRTLHSDCDAPLTLINATFDWLEANFKGKVDFVVWTGDNARHDIDSRFPRSLPEIFRLNRYVAERMRRTFGKVPVVTSIGNNDIFVSPLTSAVLQLQLTWPFCKASQHSLRTQISHDRQDQQ